MRLLKSLFLGSLLLPLAVLSAAPDTALIITSGQNPAQCIAAVHVNRIDGREVKVQELGFEIAPGIHSLSARTLIEPSFCNAVGPGTPHYKVQPLEAEFEAGKTYYLGYDHSAPRRKDWKLVIWKVEDGDQG